MTTDKRDLHADLAICNAATAHVNNDTRLRYDWNGDEFVVTTWDGIELAMDISDECFARFIAEARTGWPHAIERAQRAEAEVARLRLIFGHPLVYEALAHYTDEHIDSDARPDDWETVFDARVEAFKLAKEATADDH
jgi:hypothetical protein